MLLSVIATLNAMALKDGRKPSPPVNVFDELQYKRVIQPGDHPSFITPRDITVQRKGDPDMAPPTQNEGLISSTSWPQLENIHSRHTPSHTPITQGENDTDNRGQPEGDIGVPEVIEEKRDNPEVIEEKRVNGDEKKDNISRDDLWKFLHEEYSLHTCMYKHAKSY